MVKVKNLVKTYSMGKVSVNALRGVTLNVKKGEFISIMGSSGSGKSTLLHIVGGIDSCTSGEVQIDSKDISNMDDFKITSFRRANIGFVFQFFNLMPTLTVEENIKLPLQIAGINLKEKKERMDELLHFVGMYDRRNHKPNQLSGGEQQRVSIARALVIDPKIVLLDEPTGSLDSKNGDKVLELLQTTYKKFNSTIIMVTHSPFAAEYSEKTIFMKDGMIVESMERGSNPQYSAKLIYDKMATL